ncbi:protein BNIP5 isoform X1 [Nothobranchius furzeri]|uniref:Transcript variant X1 n=4 Tax=Nothobranchius TaxID=28779 RepID=A0A9D2XAG1_NOTFU|nr:transcript variant X1 [Nothobranchius furzeri]
MNVFRYPVFLFMCIKELIGVWSSTYLFLSGFMLAMSESPGRRSSVSSVYSVSLVEIKAETHLVLKAFLERTLSTPQKDRPGRVGGAYKDHSKYSSRPQSKSKDGYESEGEDEGQRKTSFKEFIKQLPYRNSILRSKDSKGSLGRSSKAKPSHQTEQDSLSPSSSDEDDGEKRRKQKQVKIRNKLAKFFKKRLKEKKDREKEDSGASPQRPSVLPSEAGRDSAQDLVSPSHTGGFYEELAGKLEKIARKSSRIVSPSVTLESSSDCSKEAVVQKLVVLLSSEGDAMNEKIQSDPFLRSSLVRLSYPSFAKLLDVVGSSVGSEAPPVPPPGSPTLRRMAVSMEVSRRIVTATGTQRMEGFAERYMQSFVPWVKSHGGWENVADLEDSVEYD